jgi:hypothetical protein
MKSLCPLRPFDYYDDDGQIIPEGAECMEGACAWWDESLNRCSIKSLPNELYHLRTALEKIASQKRRNGD